MTILLNLGSVKLRNPDALLLVVLSVLLGVTVKPYSCVLTFNCFSLYKLIASYWRSALSACLAKINVGALIMCRSKNLRDVTQE